MARRQWSDEEKSAVLAWYQVNGCKLRETARQWKMTESTLRHWLKGTGVNEDARRMAHIKKGAIADRLEALTHMLIDRAASDDEAEFQQVMTGIGIAVDKMRLLREQATSISKNANLNPEERADRVDELLETARTRRTGQPAPSESIVQ